MYLRYHLYASMPVNNEVIVVIFPISETNSFVVRVSNTKIQLFIRY